MSALRVARGYTGRDRIVKFVGCYHGHSDALLVKLALALLPLAYRIALWCSPRRS